MKTLYIHYTKVDTFGKRVHEWSFTIKMYEEKLTVFF